MILSACVCPGLGQLAQGRRRAGLGFLLLFLGTASCFFALGAWKIYDAYALALWFETYEPHSPPTRWLLVSFAAALGVYVWNMVDVYGAHRRQGRRSR